MRFSSTYYTIFFLLAVIFASSNALSQNKTSLTLSQNTSYITNTAFYSFKPDQISGLSLWLRSDSAVVLNGSNVAQWNDCSGANRNVIQTNSTNQPMFIESVLNNFPAIKFDGTSKFLSGDTLFGLDTSSATVFIVASGEPATGDIFRGFISIGNHQFWVTWQTNLQNLSFSGKGSYTWAPGNMLPSAGFQPKILSVRKQKGVKLEQVINNTINYSSSNANFTSNFTNGNFQIGRSTGNWGGYFKGNIFEIILFKKYLSESESNSVYNYLASKYAPSVNIGSDVTLSSFCPYQLNASANFSSYLWSTGQTTQTINVTKSGTYWVDVTNVFGLHSIDSIVVNFPKISLNDTLFCSGNTISVSANLGSAYSYQWSSGETVEAININTAGQFWVTVNDGICSFISDTIFVSEDSFPQTAWLGNDTSICSGNIIGLVSPSPLSSGISYLWSTGAITPTISITSSDDYFVTAINENNCTAKDTIHVEVLGIAPDVDFNNTIGCAGDPIQFANYSIPSGDSWLWDFGNGQISNLENPQYSFNLGGTYSVKLTVNSNGCISHFSKNINISQSPIVDFSIINACLNNPVAFFDNSSTSALDFITSWNWDFGDGSLSSAIQNPYHTYSSSGNFTVTLNIQTNLGCSKSFSKSVSVVSSAPIPNKASLSLPLNNAITSNHNIDFVWGSSENAVKYGLEYSSDPNFFTNVVRIDDLMGTNYQATISALGKYYWRILSYNLCGDSSISTAYYFTIYSPDQISDLSLWLRSDSAVVLNGSNVAQWNDCSGANRNVIQNIPSNQPLLIDSVLNNFPAIKFDGTSKFLSGDTLFGLDTSSATVFIVASGEPATGDVFRGFISIGNHQFWVTWQTSLQNLSFSGKGSYTWAPGNMLPSAGFQPKILSIRKQKGVRLEQVINNTINYSSSNANFTGNFTNGNFQIGRATGNWGGYFKGNIFEIILFKKYLSDEEHAEILNYLDSKYAPPVNLGSDINIAYGFCDTTIDAGARFTNYLWSTGETTQSISVHKSGDYTVTVTDIFGFQSSDTVKVFYPNSNLSCNDTIICLGDTININSSLSFAPNYTYQWTNGSIQNTYRSFSNENIFVVIKDINNCIDTSNTINVVIDSLKNKISFGVDTIKMCSGNSIYLASNPESIANLTFLWNDNSTDTLLTIDTSGYYWVKVNNMRGCYGSDTVYVKITGIAPTISFSANTVCFGLPTVFMNESSPSDSLFWEFGDGNTSTLLNPSHTYNQSGIYTVKLTQYANGCSNSKQKSITVKAVPIADFSYSQSCINIPTEFTNLSSANGSGTINSYNWQFDGGVYSAIENPIHTFISGGVYTVTLTIIASNLCADSKIKQVDIPTTALLPIIDLSFPINNAIISNANIKFEWTSLNAGKYIFQLSDTSSFTNILFSDTLTQTEITKYLSISSNRNFYWKVKGCNYCNEYAESGINKFTYFKPSLLAENILWLSSDSVEAINNKIKTWYDLSGNQNNAIQNNSINQPLFVDSVLNNFPAIKFDGVSSFLSGDTLFGLDTSSATVFVVASGEPATGDVFRGFFTIGNHQFWVSWQTNLQNLSFSNNGNYSWAPGDMLPSTGFQPKILSVKKQKGVKLEQIINNTIDYSSSNTNFTGNFTNGDFQIGKSTGNWGGYFKGNVYEIILFKKHLSSNESDQIFNYLTNKYASSISLGPDIHVPYGFCDTTIDAGARFTHFLWSTGDTTQSISVNKKGIYSVTVTNIFGIQSSDTINVFYPGNYIVSQPICAGDTLTWDTQLGNNYNYTWQDASTLPYLNIYQTGDYSVLVSDTNGCVYVSDTISVTVDNFSKVATLGNDTNLCTGNTIGLILGNDQVNSFAWSDGTNNTQLTINQTGNYSVTVTNATGCTAIDTIFVTVLGVAPNPAFTFNITCFGKETYFVDQSTSSTSNIINWEWNFGDGNFSSLQNPSHLYESVGNYPVSLTVTSENACNKKLTSQFIVHSLPLLNVFPLIACTNSSINFIGNELTSQPMTQWLWSFGDGTNSINHNPIHTYNEPGTYSLKLIGISDYGCADSISYFIDIKPSPTANFTQSVACTGSNVYFQNTSESLWGMQLNSLWTFDDGTESSVLNPIHMFTTSGNHEITLQITQITNGCKNEITKNITVNNPPNAVFFESNTCVKQAHELIDSSVPSGSPLSNWRWILNNLDFSHLQNTSITFQDTGIYQVKLIVMATDGCVDTTSRNISVHPTPSAAFNISSSLGIVSESVSFNNLSLEGNQFLWLFGNGDTSIIFNPNYTYQDSGVFNIQLIATNNYNCSDTAEKELTVVFPINDIAVIDVNRKIENGYLICNAIIANMGSLPILSANLHLNISENPEFMETWTGVLSSGQTMNYIFNTKLKLDGAKEPSLICVNADIIDSYADIDKYNNEFCYTSITEFTVFEPYPNPTSDDLLIEFVVPIDGNVRVDLFSTDGRKVHTIYNKEATLGVNKILLNTKTLPNGIYTYRIEYNNSVKTKRFVRN